METSEQRLFDAAARLLVGEGEPDYARGVMEMLCEVLEWNDEGLAEIARRLGADPGEHWKGFAQTARHEPSPYI